MRVYAPKRNLKLLVDTDYIEIDGTQNQAKLNIRSRAFLVHIGAKIPNGSKVLKPRGLYYHV